MITAASSATQLLFGSDPQHTSWQDIWRASVRDPHVLLDMVGVSPESIGWSREAMHQFRMVVTQGFIARMRKGDPNDPLLRQVLPLHAETLAVPGYTYDAVGDAHALTHAGVLQKYHGRALLIATGSCAIHCRYCFRRHFPYAEQSALRHNWKEAIEGIARDHSIQEVILSGGDPFSLSTEKLVQLTDALGDVAHIRRLRVHTRLPIVLPERVDAALCTWLASLPWPVTCVVHANHANEFDASVDDALRRLRQAKVHLFNQAVLLRGVNDSVGALVALSERAFASGVVPYYLHQLDHVAGAAHFAVTDAEARRMHAQLTTLLSGYLVPKLVKEIPGYASKQPM